jgi:hypothetical protein
MGKGHRAGGENHQDSEYALDTAESIALIVFFFHPPKQQGAKASNDQSDSR